MGVELGFFGGLDFVAVEDLFGALALGGSHLIHSFEDRALDVADFVADEIEIEKRLSDGTVEIKDGGSDFHD